MKKTIGLTLILVCLMALCLVFIQPVRAKPLSEDIIINADGKITPSTAPVQQTGNTYTLTSDVYGSITVKRNNTVFDGKADTLKGEFSMNNVSNVTLKNLTITDTAVGIELDDSSNVVVTNNTVTDTSVDWYLLLNGANTGAIEVSGGSSNVIIGNNLENNYFGLSFSETKNNLIVGNNITDTLNPHYTEIITSALSFSGASNNTFYHNNFINNTYLVEDSGYYGDSGETSISVNIWDDGYPDGGNYWSNYKTLYPNASEIGNSGIGDTPYFVKPFDYVEPSSVTTSEAKSYWSALDATYENNTDHYPLMEPFNTNPPKILLLSPLNQKYNEATLPLIFSVDHPVFWSGYSLDGKQNITISGNGTIINIPNGLHSVTVYANSTFGIVGASQTVSFTVAKPEHFPTALVAIVSGAVAAVVVAAGLLVYYKKHKGHKIRL